MDEPRVQLDERFARFEAQVSPTFRPAPLAEVTGRARRRRRLRRGLLAGLLTALVVAPAGGFAVAAGGHHSAPPPKHPEPTSPPGFHPTERRVTAAGVKLPLSWVSFPVDARHGWAWFERCPDPHDLRHCDYDLASTADGGLSWRRASLPDLGAAGYAVDVYPLDARTLTIHVIHKRFWLTTDGGRTFRQYPEDSPPEQARRAKAGGRFALLCPGATGFEDGADGIECDREQLVRIGSGPAAQQPPLRGEVAGVWQGGDGRIWLVSVDGSLMRVAVSTDDARTWTELPPLTRASKAYPTVTVSPGGADVWLVDSGRLWRLSGSRFLPQPRLPADVQDSNVAAVGGGMLAVITGRDENGGPAGFWRDGAFRPVEGLTAVWVGVLPYGSVQLREPDGSWVFGAEQSWYRFS